jgi:hypothetical protein
MIAENYEFLARQAEKRARWEAERLARQKRRDASRC